MNVINVYRGSGDRGNTQDRPDDLPTATWPSAVCISSLSVSQPMDFGIT